MHIRTWAKRWGIPLVAVQELEHDLGMQYTDAAPVEYENGTPGSEARVQSQVLLESAHKGYRLFRNNVGALVDDRGVPIRYGLCNDSKKLNEQFKSADLIGIKPVVITHDMAGQTIGQFASIEVKEEGWHYTGIDREAAQLKWAQLVISAGGYAAFVNKKGLLP